jgi:hypothetical protein
VLATCPKSTRVRYIEFKKFKGEILPINLCHVAHDAKICELEKEENFCFEIEVVHIYLLFTRTIIITLDNSLFIILVFNVYFHILACIIIIFTFNISTKFEFPFPSLYGHVKKKYKNS